MRIATHNGTGRENRRTGKRAFSMPLRRGICAVLTLALLLSLTACGGNPSTEGSGTNAAGTGTNAAGTDGARETTGAADPGAETTAPAASGQEGEEPDEDITALEEAIAAQYDFAAPFSEGYARVGRLDADGNMKYFYIDKTGAVISGEYDSARDFHEGLASVALIDPEKADAYYGAYLYGYIDTAGNEVIPLQYSGDQQDGEINCYSFYEGLAVVAWYAEESEGIMRSYMNLIDHDGNKVLPFDQWIETGYGGGWGEDPRILNLTAVTDNWTEYTGWSTIQSARVNARSFPLRVYDYGSDMTYWLNESLQVEKSTEGLVTEISENRTLTSRYLEDGSTANVLTDADGNILLELGGSLYASYQHDGILISTTGYTGENRQHVYVTALYSTDGEKLTGDFYSLNECGRGYIVCCDPPAADYAPIARRWALLDENLNELFSAEGTNLSPTDLYGQNGAMISVPIYLL